MGKDKDKDDPQALEIFEQLANHYATTVDTKPYNAYYERPALTSLLPEVRGKQVLDAGCAAGWYTEWLLDRGAVVTALDISPGMVAKTKERVRDRAVVRVADLRKPLDFIEDESQDIILSSLTLHYMENWDSVLGEFYQKLKAKGVLVFSVHHPMMDCQLSPLDNYYCTELLDEEWTVGEKKVRVRFYRRPLQEIINSVLRTNFKLEKIVEPQPTQAFMQLEPEDYAKLMRQPGFLCLRARKE